MNSIRIMTYNVSDCCGGDSEENPGRILDVISHAAPDVVALQGLTTGKMEDQLQFLAKRLGMKAYRSPHPTGNAFLSYYPLKGLQQVELGGAGCSLRADLHTDNRCIHLFNVRLSTGRELRREQITHLLGPDLLGNVNLVCPLLVLGDFGDFFWSPSNLALTMALRKARRPLFNGTYPARLPLVPRDRAYLRGNLRILESSIDRTIMARQAATHLPLTLTIQIVDLRNYLTLEKIPRARRMEAAPG